MGSGVSLMWVQGREPSHQGSEPSQVNKGVLLLHVDFPPGMPACNAADMDIMERLQARPAGPLAG